MNKSWLLLFLAPMISYAAHPVYESDWEQEEVQSQVVQAEQWNEQDNSVALEQEMEQLSEEPRHSAPTLRKREMRAAPRVQNHREATAYEESVTEERREGVVSEERAASARRAPQRESGSYQKRPSVTQRRAQELSQGQRPMREESAQPERKVSKPQGKMSESEWADELAERRAQRRASVRQRSEEREVASREVQVKKNSSAQVRRSQPMKSKSQKSSTKSHHPGKRPLGE